MVRINLLDPKVLADQHLVAEYDEILMLLGYVKRYPKPEGIPERYTLGKGHMKFFKDKLLYLKKRHELLKKEMRQRDFVPKKTIILSGFPKGLRNDWKPRKDDFSIIKERIIWKLRKKPGYYRYFGEYKNIEFFVEKIMHA